MRSLKVDTKQVTLQAGNCCQRAVSSTNVCLMSPFSAADGFLQERQYSEMCALRRLMGRQSVEQPGEMSQSAKLNALMNLLTFS